MFSGRSAPKRSKISVTTDGINSLIVSATEPRTFELTTNDPAMTAASLMVSDMVDGDGAAISFHAAMASPDTRPFSSVPGRPEMSADNSCANDCADMVIDERWGDENDDRVVG